MGTTIKNFCIYNGIKGIGLDGFDPMKLKGLCDFVSRYQDELFQIDDNPRIDRYKSLSIEEIKSVAVHFCKDYLSLNDIYYLGDLTKEQKQRLNIVQTYEEYYRYLDSLIKKVSIFELPIKIVPGNMFYGFLEQCIFKLNNSVEYEHRKPIFSNIQLGNNLSILSSPVLTHEYIHALEQSHMGFTDDYNNVDFLPIFIEKVLANQLGQDQLEIIERTRFLYTVEDFIDSLTTKKKERKKENISYLKSSLFATKYFDMYQSDYNKDSYFDEINDVLDGKIKVEDIINRRKLTITNTTNPSLLKKHIY